MYQQEICQDWSQSDTNSEGTNWSTAQSTQRVYEYAIEPVILQNLPDGALLFPARGTASSGLLAVECDPQIITLPGAAASLTAAGDPTITRPAAPDGWPELASPRHQPASQLWRGSPADSAPAWPQQRPAPRWPRPRD